MFLLLSSGLFAVSRRHCDRLQLLGLEPLRGIQELTVECGVIFNLVAGKKGVFVVQ